MLSLEMQTQCLLGSANFCLVYDYVVAIQTLLSSSTVSDWQASRIYVHLTDLVPGQRSPSRAGQNKRAYAAGFPDCSCILAAHCICAILNTL